MSHNTRTTNTVSVAVVGLPSSCATSGSEVKSGPEKPVESSVDVKHVDAQPASKAVPCAAASSGVIADREGSRQGAQNGGSGQGKVRKCRKCGANFTARPLVFVPGTCRQCGAPWKPKPKGDRRAGNSHAIAQQAVKDVQVLAGQNDALKAVVKDVEPAIKLMAEAQKYAETKTETVNQVNELLDHMRTQKVDAVYNLPEIADTYYDWATSILRVCSYVRTAYTVTNKLFGHVGVAPASHPFLDGVVALTKVLGARPKVMEVIAPLSAGRKDLRPVNHHYSHLQKEDPNLFNVVHHGVEEDRVLTVSAAGVRELTNRFSKLETPSMNDTTELLKRCSTINFCDAEIAGCGGRSSILFDTAEYFVTWHQAQVQRMTRNFHATSSSVPGLRLEGCADLGISLMKCSWNLLTQLSLILLFVILLKLLRPYDSLCKSLLVATSVAQACQFAILTPQLINTPQWLSALVLCSLALALELCVSGVVSLVSCCVQNLILSLTQIFQTLKCGWQTLTTPKERNWFTMLLESAGIHWNLVMSPYLDSLKKNVMPHSSILGAFILGAVLSISVLIAK